MPVKPDSSPPTPSKTARKAQSAALQDLGEQLLRLPQPLRARLALPERLVDALDMLAGIHAFGGRRRQSLYVGKLMRKLSAEQIAAIEHAVQEQHHGSAASVLRLHALERWRDRLLASDDAVTEWVAEFPRTDVQQLRALVRQARKDVALDAASDAPRQPGAAPRKNRSWRLLFQFLDTLYDNPAGDATSPQESPPPAQPG